jgi:hypothetical protein
MDKDYLIKKNFPKQDLAIRVLGMICSVGMMILCVFGFMDYAVVQPIDVVLPLYYG